MRRAQASSVEEFGRDVVEALVGVLAACLSGRFPVRPPALDEPRRRSAREAHAVQIGTVVAVGREALLHEVRAGRARRPVPSARAVLAAELEPHSAATGMGVERDPVVVLRDGDATGVPVPHLGDAANAFLQEIRPLAVRRREGDGVGPFAAVDVPLHRAAGDRLSLLGGSDVDPAAQRGGDRVHETVVDGDVLFADRPRQLEHVAIVARDRAPRGAAGTSSAAWPDREGSARPRPALQRRFLQSCADAPAPGTRTVSHRSSRHDIQSFAVMMGGLSSRTIRR